PAPFRTDQWEGGKTISLDQAKLSPGWERLDSRTNILAKRFKNRLPQMWKAARPGESVSFRFRGSTAMIYDLIGPDCGQIIVKVDDQKPIVKPRFDSFGMYHRLATLSVADGLADVVHRGELTIHKDQPDKAKILRQRNEEIEDPKRYDGTAWYAGAILLVGEWVE